MFTLVAEKFGAVGLFVSKRRYALITWACAILFAVVMIYSLALASELKADVLDYEGKIAVMSSKMERWEAAAEENAILTAENNAVESRNDVLSAENNDLSAANSELERQNGELSKKYDGLSKPN
ncbi:MAG: hypothetical protein LBN12_05020 [Clostridiales Family XIII bacterium]|jgi:cell division protein FtsB|nr:hypothetical protein [Clostridiales Family XIII bacterium]